jgi:uroporphyrin-III C-methyltransferase/precorrin-2 dehydrogenase/sirohydrochlorin ferrochelatase/uroporphyrin-III C-methyltransferase
MAKSTQVGKVVIAAAGPGDLDLITVRAANALKKADVVIADRLVNRELISRYCRKGIEVIDAGKQAGKECSISQQRINELLVSYASQGLYVVRLKGGDVSIFSNILDELDTLRNKGIRYEIVPGVTAALGAAAYAGIPLTARGIASGVRLLTFNNPALVTEAEWGDWAVTHDTLVFYMASQTLAALTQKLVEKGIPADKPLAVIEQATTPVQQVLISTVGEFAEVKLKIDFLSPALVIIGEVVTLHPQFRWFKSNPERVHFFEPLRDEKEYNPEASSSVNQNQPAHVAGT